jgi:predicted phosphodiesterase
MNITRKWKRFAVVSCSHGHLMDPSAGKSVTDFIKAFQPHRFDHAGDYTDLSPMMGGGKGDGDPLGPDVEEGLAFLEQLKAYKDLELVIHDGNHEVRLRRLSQSSNQVISECARLLLVQIQQHCLKLKAKQIPYNGIWEGSRIGNGLITHGSIYNENACRDMAEMYCKGGVSVVIFGHTHSPGIAKGRRDDSPLGINVGTLTRTGCMDYASGRRKTFSWGQAICYGEYSDDLIIPTLYVHPQELAGQPWRINV